MNTITEGSERIESSLDHTDNLVKKSSKSKSRRKKHSHRHKDADSTDGKEDFKSHSSKKSKKKKKKIKEKQPAPILSPSDIVIDGSLSEDSQDDIILKAEVSLPSRRQLTAGISMSDDSYSESSPSDDSPSDDSFTDEDIKTSVSSSRSSHRQSSSRTRGASSKPRAKNKMSRHKRDLINALTPIEGEYLTVQRKPAMKSRQAEVSPKPTRSRKAHYEVSPKPERRKPTESPDEDSHEVIGSESLNMSDALLKKEIRAQIGQGSQPGAVPVSSSASRHEKSKGKVDLKPTIAKIGTDPSPSSSAGAQLEELRAKRKPLAPKKKKDANDEDRHKRELMKELTPTDYRTVTRARASIPKPPPSTVPEKSPVLKSPPSVHLPNEDRAKDKSGGKKKGRKGNPFSSVKKIGRR